MNLQAYYAYGTSSKDSKIYHMTANGDFNFNCSNCN